MGLFSERFCSIWKWAFQKRDKEMSAISLNVWKGHITIRLLKNASGLDSVVIWWFVLNISNTDEYICICTEWFLKFWHIADKVCFIHRGNSSKGSISGGKSLYPRVTACDWTGSSPPPCDSAHWAPARPYGNQTLTDIFLFCVSVVSVRFQDVFNGGVCWKSVFIQFTCGGKK